MGNTTGFKFLSALALILFFSFKEIPPVNKCRVKITITESHQYCGGVELSPEEMAPKAVIVPGKKIYIREGISNNISIAAVAMLLSDSAGNVQLDLKPGKYCIVDEKKNSTKYVKEVYKRLKKADKYNSAVTMDCLKKWMNTPDLVFTVEEKELNVIKLNYDIPCSWSATPCTVYNGPLPP
jgi:hypothetical protein